MMSCWPAGGVDGAEMKLAGEADGLTWATWDHDDVELRARGEGDTAGKHLGGSYAGCEHCRNSAPVAI